MTDNEAGEKQAPRLVALVAQLGATQPRGPAPVELWNPPYCGEIDMRIAADGTWFHEGAPIRRPALVALFASVLRRDPDRFVLVTPVERVGIRVDDAPFVAVTMVRDDDRLEVVTNLGETVEVGERHGLRFAVDADGGIKPYVHIRGDLWARFTRSLAIDLLDGVTREVRDGAETLGVHAGGCFFPIAPAATLTA